MTNIFLSSFRTFLKKIVPRFEAFSNVSKSFFSYFFSPALFYIHGSHVAYDCQFSSDVFELAFSGSEFVRIYSAVVECGMASIDAAAAPTKYTPTVQRAPKYLDVV